MFRVLFLQRDFAWQKPDPVFCIDEKARVPRIEDRNAGDRGGRRCAVRPRIFRHIIFAILTIADDNFCWWFLAYLENITEQIVGRETAADLLRDSTIAGLAAAVVAIDQRDAVECEAEPLVSRKARQVLYRA